MKKTYASPLANEVSVATESMIATSFQTHDTTVDTSTAGVQLGNTHRGEWGNLWSK